MRYAARPGVLAVLALLACISGWAVERASAQSLAQVAKQEEARRKAVKKPAKVYTNRSLAAVAGDVLPAEAGAKPEPQPATSKPAPSAPPAPEPPKDPKSTPEYWRQRMAEARQEADRNSLMIDALQSRVNALWADFTARDDPAQRSVIATDRQKALDELERCKQQQVVLTKAIDDVQEEARRAKVPPGWLR